MTRTSIFTGAGGDLGSAVAHRRAAQGDRVILVDLNTEALDSTLSSLAGEISIHAAYLLCEAPPCVNGAIRLTDGCRR